MNNITSQHGQHRRGKAACRAMRAAGGALITLGLSLGFTHHAAAADFSLDLPAGQGCDFDLRIENIGAPNRVSKNFYDKSGNLVRTLEAGKGNSLTFSNLSNTATYSPRPNGSVAHTQLNADGTSTVTLTGHNVLILFPTDIPKGPTTTLYVGKVVYTVDTSGVFTVVSTSGKQVDICAALSG